MKFNFGTFSKVRCYLTSIVIRCLTFRFGLLSNSDLFENIHGLTVNCYMELEAAWPQDFLEEAIETLNFTVMQDDPLLW